MSIDLSNINPLFAEVLECALETINSGVKTMEKPKNAKAQPIAPEGQIYINDVKKGWQVLYAGNESEMLDNGKGIIRCIKTPVWGMPGHYDFGSVYADQITRARKSPSDPWLRVIFTDRQREQLRKIHLRGF